MSAPGEPAAHICDVFPFGKRAERQSLAEHTANAHLIAAVPDLLASLKEAVHLFETYGLIANIRNGVEDKSAPGRWVNEARDAIAKAERTALSSPLETGGPT